MGHGRGPSKRTGVVNLQAGEDRQRGFDRKDPHLRFVVGTTIGDPEMTPHIDAPPHAALDLLPVLNFDGEERRSGDDRRNGTDRRSGEDRRGANRAHHLPRRMRGDRRGQKGIGGRRVTD